MYRNVCLFVVLIIASECQTEVVFHYVSDLSEEWKTVPIDSTTDEHQIPDSHVAWAIYSNTINETGFAQLEVHSNERYADNVQAYHAGFIEGYLTGELMAMHWRNQLETYCVNQVEYCTKLFKFLDTNLKFTQTSVTRNRKTNSYWHHVGLVLEQLTGLQDGYNLKMWSHKPKKPRMEVDSKGLISLNLLPELGELEQMLNKTIPRPTGGSCSAIVKPLEDGSDLYVAHDTWVWHSMMLRIIKKYHLNYRIEANDGTPAPGRVTSFSSYPGALFSIDDFYIIGSGLVVQETSITNINHTLWESIKPGEVVLEFIRNLVANRLARSGKQWTEIFAMHNSGTYNNQFMIVDYNKFSRGTPPQNLADNLLWILEQMPGIVLAEDKTDILRSEGYWASYNVPYFEHIFNISGYNKLVELYGDYYSYNDTARAKIFRRDHGDVDSLNSLYFLMRHNNFEFDELSRCNCTPPHTAEYAIAARDDLNDPNGTYPFDALGFRDWGAIDAKITSLDMSKNLEMLFVSSPPYEQFSRTRFEPFQWSTTKLPKSIRHEGHPDKWAFAPYFLRWFPSTNEIAGVSLVEARPS